MTPKAIVVSTTHWDRAWYVTFQEFRLALVDLVDQVLDLLDRGDAFRAFMLDGQSVTLEDYLEVRPERAGDVRRHVEAGRLAAGPWYVLPDEYLVSPEALVRNLLMGTKVADRLGGAMRVGYNPDAFGHVAQLPQILQGFGIDTALFWRGFGDEGETIPNEFWWEAPDGSRVLAEFLRFGYGNAANVGYPQRWGEVQHLRFDPTLADRQIREAIAAAAARSACGVVLLLNGTDHVRAQPEIGEVVERLSSSGLDVRHGTLAEFAGAVQERVGAAGREPLPVVRAEFNRGRYSHILQGVYSARMPIKQRNWAVQQLLERGAEPAATVAWLEGAPYPAGALDVAWRWLLQNHPHDDICGCSVDQVHREDMYRFDQAEQIGRAVRRRALRHVAERIRLERPDGAPGAAVMVLNPSPRPRAGAAFTAEVPFEEGTRAAGVLVRDARGRRVAAQLLGVREVQDAEPRRAGTRHALDLALAMDLPPAGYRTIYVRPTAGNDDGQAPGAGGDPVAHPVVCEERAMHNGRVRLALAEDGALWLDDLEARRRFGPLHVLEDTEDAGDEYDYSPAPHSSTVWSAGRVPQARWIARGPLRAALELSWDLPVPAELGAGRCGRSADQVRLLVVTRASLAAGSRRVEFETSVANRARDHRLRVHFASGLDVPDVLVDGHFALLRRPVRAEPRPGWVQPLVATGLARRFVAVGGRSGGLAVLTGELPEYEAVPGPRGVAVAVTLLRCVGWLSRDDLATRPGHAGPALETPEAQLVGEHRFRYAVAPFATEEQLLAEAEAYHHPVVAVRADTASGFLPGEVAGYAREGRLVDDTAARTLPDAWSWLEIEGDEGVDMVALKRSEDGQAVVLRLACPGDRPRTVRVRPHFTVARARRARLDEAPLADLPVEGGCIELAIGAHQVATLLLTPAAPGGD